MILFLNIQDRVCTDKQTLLIAPIYQEKKEPLPISGTKVIYHLSCIRIPSLEDTYLSGIFDRDSRWLFDELR